jgi:hypothetical protein
MAGWSQFEQVMMVLKGDTFVKAIHSQVSVENLMGHFIGKFEPRHIILLLQGLKIIWNSGVNFRYMNYLASRDTGCLELLLTEPDCIHVDT